MVLVFSIMLMWVGLFLILVLLEKLKIISNFTRLISKIYRGYHSDNFSGIFTGFSWAVLDGLITGAVIAGIMRFID